MIREPAVRPRGPFGATGVGPLALLIAAMALAIAMIALPNVTPAPDYGVTTPIEWAPGLG